MRIKASGESKRPSFTTIAPATTPAAVVGPSSLGEPDQPAELESTFDLERFYPRSARLRGISARTRMRITIDATGKVANITVLESTPTGVFEEATDRLASSLRFRPARQAGKPVATTKDLIIDWTLK